MQPATTCGRCGVVVEADATRCPKCGRLWPSLFGQRRRLDAWFDNDRPFSKPLGLFLIALFLLTCLVAQRRGDFVSAGLFGLGPGIATLVQFGGMYTDAFLAGEWWRPITGCLLHAGILHIAFNVVALWQLGSLIVAAYGNARFTILLFVSGTLAFITTMTRVPFTIGASGAVFGLVGAAIAYGYRRGGEHGAMVRGYGFQWLAYGAIFGLLMPGINNWAHGAGAVVGFATAWTFDVWRLQRGRESDGARLLALGMILVTAVALIWGVTVGFRLF